VIGAGSFSNGQGGPTTTVDCRDAATPCTIYTWAAHTDSVAAWRTTQPLTFLADDVDPGTDPGTGGGGGTSPRLSVSQTSGLSPFDSTTVNVTGSGYKTTYPGIYVAWGPAAGTLDRDAYGTAKWVYTSNGEDASHATLNADGSFSTSLVLAPTFGATNCTIIQCYVQTFAALGAIDPSQTQAVAISYAGTVASSTDTPATPDLVPAVPTTAPTTTPTTAANATTLVGPKLTKVAVGQRGKVSMRVSEPSTVTFTVRRKVGKHYVVVKTVAVTARQAGAISANLKITKKGLYRITVQAKGSDGATKTVVKSLRIT
jgi:hypothetical protein